MLTAAESAASQPSMMISTMINNIDISIINDTSINQFALYFLECLLCFEIYHSGLFVRI